MAKLTIDSFLARSPAGPSSITLYGRELRLLERRLGMPLGEASVRAIERLKTDLRKQTSGPQRAKLLRLFYKTAGRKDLIEILKLKQRVKRLSPNDILTLPEVNGILGAAGSLRNRALVALLWETGARAHEVCALRIRDVQEVVSKENGGRKLLTVFFPKTKVAGEEHSSLLIESAGHVRTWLDAYAPASEDAPLLPSATGDHLTQDGVLRVIKRAGRRAGITKRVYSHLFRHSRATHLLRIGVSETNVRQLLGWVPNSPMLSRYSHMIQKDAYAALLKAHGMEPPEAVDVGKLVAEGDLQPVKPMRSAVPANVQSASAVSMWDPVQVRAIRDFLQELEDVDPLTLRAMSLVQGGETLATLREKVRVVQAAKVAGA